MKITETILKGCYILEPVLFEDERGLFYEAYQKKRLEESIGREVNFVQDNVSISRKGVLRGLHFQKGIHAQAKLVHVLKGEVLDVIVDLREGSPTFGKHFATELSAENKKMLFLEKGMAHGFLALTEEVIFAYKCDAIYNPASESGIFYNDPALGIDWNISEKEVIISNKDRNLPLLKDVVL